MTIFVSEGEKILAVIIYATLAIIIIILVTVTIQFCINPTIWPGIINNWGGSYSSISATNFSLGPLRREHSAPAQASAPSPPQSQLLLSKFLSILYPFCLKIDNSEMGSDQGHPWCSQSSDITGISEGATAAGSSGRIEPQIRAAEAMDYSGSISGSLFSIDFRSQMTTGEDSVAGTEFSFGRGQNSCPSPESMAGRRRIDARVRDAGSDAAEIVNSAVLRWLQDDNEVHTGIEIIDHAVPTYGLPPISPEQLISRCQHTYPEATMAGQRKKFYASKPPRPRSRPKEKMTFLKRSAFVTPEPIRQNRLYVSQEMVTFAESLLIQNG